MKIKVKIKKEFVNRYREFIDTIQTLPTDKVQKYISDTYQKLFHETLPESLYNSTLLARNRICYYLLFQNTPSDVHIPIKHMNNYRRAMEMNSIGTNYKKLKEETKQEKKRKS